ncbi:MAG: hypothetical protein HOE90_00985 [Bacteriovoracaceae bacterium]|jgi:hypothetical protein|nr:hypothetical protein [Bacteriovoracaceae bacterium]
MKLTNILTLTLSFIVASLCLAGKREVGNGSDVLHFKMIDAKELAVAAVDLVSSSDLEQYLCPAETQVSEIDTRICTWYRANRAQLKYELENSETFLAPTEFIFADDQVYSIADKELGDDKDDLSRSFMIGGVEKNMMTGLKSKSPIFVNIMKSVNQSVFYLTKSYLHEAVHHFGIKDENDSEPENNFPDRVATKIISKAIGLSSSLQDRLYVSQGTVNTGFLDETLFDLKWIDIDRGDRHGPKGRQSYKAKETVFDGPSRIRLAGIFNPKPEFFLEVRLCNRTAPVVCEKMKSFEYLPTVLKRTKDKHNVNKYLSFTGQDMNFAFHGIHNRVHPSGDPKGYDLTIFLMEENWESEICNARKGKKKKGEHCWSNEEYAKFKIPLEDLFIKSEFLSKSVIDNKKMGLSGKESGATARFDLIKVIKLEE